MSKCDYGANTNYLYHFSGIFFHPQLFQKCWYINSHWQIFLVGESSFCHPYVIFLIVVLKIFRLDILWYFLHGPNRTSCQCPRTPQRLCQLQLVFLDHSSPIVHNMRSLRSTKLAAGMWHSVAKAPLPKVWQRNTTFSNMFPCLFELKPLPHFEILHLHH